jgi:hypothetical protein
MFQRASCLTGLTVACLVAISPAQGTDTPATADTASTIRATDGEVQGAAPISADSSTANTTAASADDSASTPPPTRFRFGSPPPPDMSFLYDSQAELDLDNGVVRTRRTIGGRPVGIPNMQTLDAFMNEYIASKLDERFEKKRTEMLAEGRDDEGMRLELLYEIPNLPPMAKSIIGEGPSSLHISGYGRITMEGRTRFVTNDGNQDLPGPKPSKFPTLAMKQELSFQINGTIGSKIFVSIDQDTKRFSDLENNIRIRYQGEEDEVVQEVELGNTNLSLQGPQFISGGRQNRGLFGVKSRAVWGDMEWTFIASQQKSSTQKKTLRGGAQDSEREIADIAYLQDRFFFLDESFRTQYEESLAELRANPLQKALTDFHGKPNITLVEVYEPRTNSSSIKSHGVAIVDPFYDTETGSYNTKDYQYDQNTGVNRPPEAEERDWDLMRNDLYTVYPELGYIDFQGNPVPKDIAVRIYYDGGNEDTQAFPAQDSADIVDNGPVLKLIRSAGQTSNSPTWKLAWRHVYSLGAVDLKWDDIQEFDIVYTGNSSRPNTTVDGDFGYLELFHLDVANADLTSEGADLTVDQNRAKINLSAGLVFFPFLEPFREAFEEAKIDITGESSEGNAVMYKSNNQNDLNASSRYVIIAKYSRPSSKISLGFDILEDSEAVTLNGEKLIRGVDYTINYFTGELSFSQRTAGLVSQPNADLTIDYESNPLFKPDQETLLGARGVYRIGDKGQLGTTFMFNSERTSSFRVRVGEEPTRMTMLGADASYEFEPYWLTAMVDKIPLIETDERSSIRFQGEVAQSLPNLNTRGKAYIDDFEAAGNINPIGLLRRGWSIASTPLDETNINLDMTHRSPFAWFNTLQQFQAQDIWTGHENDPPGNYVSVMHLWFRPEGNTRAERAQDWGGITKAYGSSGIDLDRTQFIEIWMRIDTTYTVPGRTNQSALLQGSPVLHIDLGTISEDVITVPPSQRRFDDPNLNSEDLIMRGESAPHPIEGHYVDPSVGELGDDFLNTTETNAGEDVGLDGCPDEYEDGFGGCGDFPRTDLADDEDPNGDNFVGPEDRKNPNPRSFGGINGTEGNRNDLAVGYPTADTEDIDGNGSLDTRNEYISYTVDLTGFSEYIVEDTVLASGFRQYRIPIHLLDLQSVSERGSAMPSFDQIKSVRLWVSGVEDEQLWITLAGLDFVGNDWQEVKKVDDPFAVTTINTDQSTKYLPPPEAEIERGSRGEQLPEQSLSFEMGAMLPGQSYRAQRVFTRSKDLTNYRRMRMYIHGPYDIDRYQDHLSAFLRLGLDSTIYYEIRVPKIYPGWDTRNYIDVELDSLTQLKLRAEGEIFGGIDTVKSSDGTMRIVGSLRGSSVSLPTLSDIKMLALGVTNQTSHSIYVRSDGAGLSSDKPVVVWFDDLFLDDVRNIPGRAYRGDLSIQMADLVRFDAGATRKDVGFQSLQSIGGSGDRRGVSASQKEQNDFRLSMNRLRIDKVLPPNWRVQIPFDVSYSHVSTVPRLKPNSDIQLVTEEDRRSEKSTSQDFRMSTSFAKSSRSPSMLIGMTLDRSSLGVGYSQSQKVIPQASKRDSTRQIGYTARLNYDLTPRGTHRIQPFGWSARVMPEAVSEAELTYLPTSLRFDATASYRYDSTRTKRLDLGADSTRAFGSEKFSLTESYKVQVQPFRSVSSGYDLKVARNLQDDIHGWINPSEATRVVGMNIFRENEINRNHKYNLSYSPTWPSWLTHSYSFSNTYSDNSDPRDASGFGREREFRVESNRQYKISNFTLKLKDILYWVGGVDKTGRSDNGPRRPYGDVAESPADSTSSKPSRSVLDFTIRPVARFFGNRLDNFSGGIGYEDRYSGQQIPEPDRPDMIYQVFGLGQNPPLEASVGVTQSNSISRKLNYNVGSGFALPFKMRLRGKFSFNEQTRFTTTDTSRTRSIVFPDINYEWDGLEDLPILNRLATSSDIQSSFSRAVKEKWERRRGFDGEFLQNRDTKFRLDPLLVWNVLWKNDIRSSIRGQYTRTYTDVAANSVGSGGYTTTLSNNWGVTANASYELETSRGMKVFGKKFQLQGDVNFTFDASVNGSRSWVPGGAASGGDKVNSNTQGWNVKPRASYRFSRSFTGQAELEVGQQKDLRIHRTTHIRMVRVTGELRFN